MGIFTLRYMTKFACLGGSCPDTCCGGWEVNVDREHYELLHGKMTSPSERAELDAGTRLVENSVREDRHALVVMREDHTCSFLSGDGLCSLHARYGAELLPNACAIYPRVLAQLDGFLELHGSLSCPEVARMVLTDDDALDMVSGDKALVARKFVAFSIEPKETKDPYDANFQPIRALMMQVLGRTRYPIASRLFFIAWLADKSRDFLRRRAKTFDFARLQKLGSSLQDPKTLASLDKILERTVVDSRFAFEVVREMVRVPPQLFVPRLQALIAELDAVLTAQGCGLSGEADALQRSYRSLPGLAPERAARLDSFIERYVRVEVMKNWFALEPTFIGWYHFLLARAATLRFFIGVLGRAHPDGDFDDIAVRIVYLLARTLDHNKDLAKRAVQSFEARGMSLENATALLRL
jgi:hypothetical protein